VLVAFHRHGARAERARARVDSAGGNAVGSAGIDKPAILFCRAADRRFDWGARPRAVLGLSRPAVAAEPFCQRLSCRASPAIQLLRVAFRAQGNGELPQV